MNIIKKLLSKKKYYKSRYQQLSYFFETIRPCSMIEIGVWTGERSSEFIRRDCLEVYHGFDLFEDITKEIQDFEAMGTCHMVFEKDIWRKLKSIKSQTSIELHKGNTINTLPDFKKNSNRKYEFILLDGGHNVETIDNDWKYCKELLSTNGTCIFDDYYLNTDSKGCKKLINSLDRNIWEVDFFSTIEKNVNGDYLTMVFVKHKS